MTDQPLWFKGEKWMVVTGLLGFALALVCGLGALLLGTDETPGSGMAKAVSFNAALGIFLLSTAAVSPFAGWGRKSRAFFRWSYIALALFSYFAETVQHIRGVNPRFAMDGSAFDLAVANGFGMAAMLLVVFYLGFAAAFFRKRASQLQPSVVLSVRYAMVAVLFSFAGGICISINGGRFIGLEGNLIWFHGLGFHALQVLPITAWLAIRSSMTIRLQRTLIHIAGVSFIGGLLAIGLQTLQERTLLEWSLLPLAALAFFIVTTAASLRACLEAVRSKKDGSTLAG
ncbi:hypothetical protein D3P07_14700 [Paenibacillus sp. 1011MAR3C5]|uniref:hypothetical protein n=1 Tax=Paenibacillus sp. 1011MAR3C5 TaxID=1675787 RepID=UPI000E6CCE6D|nr:hypothetical protein [Paenibacillus sp. 1011MAR3C5]RJE87567.1 hypothetical protein D3P07_14700 [Paenibacillus sp. 1011MAR3C5]